MEPPSPARLYAGAAGAVLVALGIVGFFYDASFAPLDDLEPALGVLEVNAWFNLLYVATGAAGVLSAGVASRGYCLVVGVLYTLLAIFGPGSSGLHLVIGLFALGAAAGTPSEKAHRVSRVRRARPRKRPRSSEARAQAARNRT